jgi:antitoxin (DNA-binding transcriptional repressor) of toxin-antitoxin stability system
MDIDVSQLPAQAAEAVVVRHEQVRVLRDGLPVATVVPAKKPVARSLQAFRDRIPPLDVTFAELLREERDER